MKTNKQIKKIILGVLNRHCTQYETHFEYYSLLEDLSSRKKVNGSYCLRHNGRPYLLSKACIVMNNKGL